MPQGFCAIHRTMTFAYCNRNREFFQHCDPDKAKAFHSDTARIKQQMREIQIDFFVGGLGSQAASFKLIQENRLCAK